MNKANSKKLSKYNLVRLVRNSLSAIRGVPGAASPPPRNTGETLSAEHPEGKTRVSCDPPQPLLGEEEATTSATHTQPQLLHPFETIPLELLQLIMWEILSPSSWMLISAGYYHITQLRLVCKRWTQALEGMPEVWAKLSLKMNERLIDLALSRSLHSPLSIDLTGYRFSSSALDKLLQHINRWKYLAIYDVGDGCVEQLAAQSFPILEELTVFNTLLVNRSNISFSGSAPMLRTVHISWCRIQWSASILSNLRELVLTRLIHEAPDMDTFLKLLSNSPKLARLLLRNTHLTPSSSPQDRVPLLYLQKLEIDSLGQDLLMQLLESIAIPTSTTCRFSFALKDPEETPINEQLEPIGQRLRTLAEISRGTRSILTLRSGSVSASYEGESDLHGKLAITILGSDESNHEVLEYFASQLSQGEPNPFPPVLRIVDPIDPASFNKWGLLLRLRKYLPNTEEIQIDHIDACRSTELAFNALFLSKPSSPPFPRLTTLVILDATDRAWVEWLQRLQKRRFKRGRVNPLPLTTLKQAWSFVMLRLNNRTARRWVWRRGRRGVRIVLKLQSQRPRSCNAVRTQTITPPLNLAGRGEPTNSAKGS